MSKSEMVCSFFDFKSYLLTIFCCIKNSVVIDPPYNTGSAFEHYDDNLEHSIWLDLMRERLKTVKVLVLFFIRLDLFGKVNCCS